MKLVCLGTTGFHPNDRRHTATYLLPEVGVVLDAGTGMYRLAGHLTTEHLHVFLSHAHLDHVSGLTYLIETFGVDAYDQVTIHGRVDKLESVRTHLFAPHLFPVAPAYRFEELGEVCPLPVNPAGEAGELRTFPLAHPGGSIGMRLDWPGHSLAYVTDTAGDASADYVEHLKGVDLLLHEANFPAGYNQQAELTGHTCVDQAAQVAAAAGVGRLVLTHLDPKLSNDRDFDLSEAERYFAPVQIAHDLDEFDF